MDSEITPPEGCAFIKVGKDQVALIDADMYDELSKFKWSVSNGYAVYSVRTQNGTKNTGMHRIVNKTPEDAHTDHINGITLDNRRCNLRTCTAQENRWNTSKRSTSKMNYKGVTSRRVGGWSYYDARIVVNGERIYLGSFSTEREAAQAYENVARHIHGEFFRPGDL